MVKTAQEAHDCASKGIRSSTRVSREVRYCGTKSRGKEKIRMVLYISSGIIYRDVNVVQFPRHGESQMEGLCESSKWKD